MGDAFRHGLLRAAGMTGTELNLSAKLGGNRPTALRVVTEMMAILTKLE